MHTVLVKIFKKTKLARYQDDNYHVGYKAKLIGGHGRKPRSLTSWSFVMVLTVNTNIAAITTQSDLNKDYALNPQNT